MCWDALGPQIFGVVEDDAEDLLYSKAQGVSASEGAENLVQCLGALRENVRFACSVQKRRFVFCSLRPVSAASTSYSVIYIRLSRNFRLGNCPSDLKEARSEAGMMRAISVHPHLSVGLSVSVSLYFKETVATW